MIPIRDINPRTRIPWVNYALLLGIGAIFVLEVLGDEARVAEWVGRYAFVPTHFFAALHAQDSHLLFWSLGTIVTSLFLHGGWFHVIGNLLFLRVFGDNIEEKFGHLLFFVFYLASGVAGALAHAMAEPESAVPVIGASGAIAGVLGAYIIMFPTAKIVTLFPILIFLTFIELPAFLFLGLWAAQQLLNGYLSIGGGGRGLTGGVAWFAHIGGFGVGVVAGGLWRLWWRKRRRRLTS
ncbi:MAG: rhomboid family intramembrane serine protease [Deltaproteobacteria bacterium]|nr:rhomboid family intramembrane serine protease [Deltaproteobacteria bacterium]